MSCSHLVVQTSILLIYQVNLIDGRYLQDNKIWHVGNMYCDRFPKLASKDCFLNCTQYQYNKIVGSLLNTPIINIPQSCSHHMVVKNSMLLKVY